MKYAVRENGQIVGWSRWPNSTSKTPVDEQGAEWLAFLASKRVSEQDTFDSKLLSEPVFKALIDEIESTNPGFRTRVRNRLDTTKR
jgi:hypothetical protein